MCPEEGEDGVRRVLRRGKTVSEDSVRCVLGREKTVSDVS